MSWSVWRVTRLIWSWSTVPCGGGGDTHMLKHLGLRGSYQKSIEPKHPWVPFHYKKKKKKKKKERKSLQDGTNSQKLWKTCKILGGGYSNYFLTKCEARGLKPLPISKDFSHSKTGWIDGFLEFFANWDPFVRVFLSQKRPILPFFSQILWNGTLL